MLKLKIISVGKTKEKWLEEAFAEYQKRLKTQVSLECLWAKDDAQLIEWAKKESIDFCLDPKGDLMDSETFATYLQHTWEKKGSRLTCIIGGAEGIPREMKAHSQLISLSRLTFTHQITRLIFIEQIYRAIEINKGSNYHK